MKSVNAIRFGGTISLIGFVAGVRTSIYISLNACS